ncbi:MAG TPA: HIT family protein [Bacillota bacterium]|nr:HIT family protein [Candidatus Fermentithermobacillaceae bacterium]HOB30719.1 HIT family protein [Bacillota bacterium]HOK64575.1 HIT family protein [Bacillota bacterium]HOL12088.1 HIT family protein [Bacillota bacterium]HOQ03076.1 HIT family protein [Bacillota bacterium]
MYCPFCNPEQVVVSNELAYAIYDKYPVSPGHMLIITKRHTPDIFSTTPEERQAMYEIIEKCKSILDEEKSPDGYNVGINCGKPAGQTIFHVHVHLIPRYKGDVENPRGGVRRVVPHRHTPMP